MTGDMRWCAAWLASQEEGPAKWRAVTVVGTGIVGWLDARLVASSSFIHPLDVVALSAMTSALAVWAMGMVCARHMDWMCRYTLHMLVGVLGAAAGRSLPLLLAWEHVVSEVMARCSGHDGVHEMISDMCAAVVLFMPTWAATSDWEMDEVVRRVLGRAACVVDVLGTPVVQLHAQATSVLHKCMHARPCVQEEEEGDASAAAHGVVMM